VKTGNAQAIDLICRRYSVGSPSEYLRRSRSIVEIAFDFAMANQSRKQEIDAVDSGLDDAIRSMSGDLTAERLTAVTLQWLLKITAYR